MPNAGIHVEGADREDDDDRKINRGSMPAPGGHFVRIRRAVRGAKAGFRGLLVAASTIAMVLMVVYELLYLGALTLPWMEWNVSGFVYGYGWTGALITVLIF